MTISDRFQIINLIQHSVGVSDTSLPFRRFGHELHIQITSWKVVPVGSELTVEACTEARLRCRPVQHSDVWGQNPV